MGASYRGGSGTGTNSAQGKFECASFLSTDTVFPDSLPALPFQTFWFFDSFPAAFELLAAVKVIFLQLTFTSSLLAKFLRQWCWKRSRVTRHAKTFFTVLTFILRKKNWISAESQQRAKYQSESTCCCTKIKIRVITLNKTRANSRRRNAFANRVFTINLAMV